MKVTKQCSECGSHEIYTNKSLIEGQTLRLFPDLGNFFDPDPAIEVYVCGECGHYKLFLQPRTLAQVKERYKRYK